MYKVDPSLLATGLSRTWVRGEKQTTQAGARTNGQTEEDRTTTAKRRGQRCQGAGRNRLGANGRHTNAGGKKMLKRDRWVLDKREGTDSETNRRGKRQAGRFGSRG